MLSTQVFCTQCGNSLSELTRFCPVCGKAVGATPAVPQNTYLPQRKLHRITRNKKIAGVCAGFADYFEMDVTLMRIIFLALLVLPPGVGLIGYVIAWIAMPRDA